MTENITLPHQPGRNGQWTAVEASRAVAEVQAAILVAQERPRHIQQSLTAMRESCSILSLAERAFFRVPRGEKTATGESIHLARELARCWGNIQWGVMELSRDDNRQQSEIMAYAWDLQSNTRPVSVFIVPHKRDRKNGRVEPLSAMRDIYENNANAGARRVRECIFSVLPTWYIDEAKDLCRATLRKGASDKSLPQRIADAIAKFGSIGVREEQITAKLGRPSDRWDADDLDQLGIIWRSLERREISRDEEFPAATVTAAEIAAAAPVSAPPPTGAQSEPGPTKSPPVSRARMARLTALLGDGGFATAEARLRVASHVLERDIFDIADLTAAEVETLITHLQQRKEAGRPGQAAPEAGPAAEATTEGADS